MSEARFNLDQLRTAYRSAAADAILRVRQSNPGEVTTAERGFSGRVVTFFRPDKEGNSAIGASLLNGLKQEYGDAAGTAAFRLVRDGIPGSGFDASKPITARQAHQMEDFARSLSVAGRRDALLASATPMLDGQPGFPAIATQAGVDATQLTADQKELYGRLLQQRVLADGEFGRVGAPLPDGGTLREIAAATLVTVAAMDPEAVAQSEARLADQQFAGSALLRGLGTTGGDPRSLALDLARFERLAVNTEQDVAPGQLPSVLRTMAREVALDRVLTDMNPAEAHALFTQAMAKDGPGRAMLFASAVQAHAAAAGADAEKAVNAAALSGASAAALEALGRRAGVEDAAAQVASVLDAAREAGERLGGLGSHGPAQLTTEESEAAGIGSYTVAQAALSAAPAGLNKFQTSLTDKAARAMDAANAAVTLENLTALHGTVLDEGRFDPLIRDALQREAVARGLPDLEHAYAHLSDPARVEIRALVIDAAKHTARADMLRGDAVPRLDDTGVQAMLDRAVARAMPAITAIVTRPPSDDRLHAQLMGGPTGPTMQRITDIAQRRQDARLSTDIGGGGQFDQAEARRIAAELAALPNRDLLGHLRNLTSVPMLDLRLTLQTTPNNLSAASALMGLNMFEAQVNEEIAARVLQSSPEIGAAQGGLPPLTDRQLTTLADIEARSFRRDLNRQNDAYLEGNMAAAYTHTPSSVTAADAVGLPVDDLAAVLKEADLTINLGTHLFKPGGPFIDAQKRPKPEAMKMQNIFERPADQKGPLYIERRVAFEHAEMPTLRMLDMANGGPLAADHPVSAGVNVGRNIGGAAPSYGKCLVILKDEVKQNRATFTARDSFQTSTAVVTQASADAFMIELERRIADASPGLGTPADWRQLKRDLPEIRNRLDAAAKNGTRMGLGETKGLGGFVQRDLLAGLKSGEMSKGESILGFNLLLNLTAKHLNDPVESPGHVATFQRMGEILGGVKNTTAEPVLAGIAATASDPLRVNAVAGGYIEAQVFGGIDLTRDVKEIRIAPGELDDDTRQSLVQFGQQYNFPVTFLDPNFASITRLDDSA